MYINFNYSNSIFAILGSGASTMEYIVLFDLSTQKLKMV